MTVTPLLDWSSPGFVVTIGLYILFASVAHGLEPYHGTVWINPGVITAADPTTFLSLDDAGRHDRQVWDSRIRKWSIIKTYVFNARYDDGLLIEVLVNPEYGSTSAATQVADRYARILGQIPTGLRVGVNMLTIHKGYEGANGGGNHDINLHEDHAEETMARGFLEEMILHEAVHATLGPNHNNDEDWQRAQTLDGMYISTYARDYPHTEDLAESLSTWFLARFRTERMPDETLRTIYRSIPNRLAYFDALLLDMYPYGGRSTVVLKTILTAIE
ncbi:MAG: hypothetical protein OXC69_05235 [Candidatus Tectomicrobia bacterium]|nr:hypothetical protein [Candidatus Tectomicrobia bacterium]